ncbi:MAG: phosphatidate cytidylyltransferase [Clostridia bacterium]|nr:phosphatidate cytidylyltransferase [Clostridia bacterium]
MKANRFLTGTIIFAVYAGVLALSLTVTVFAFDIFIVALMIGAGLEMSRAIGNRFAKSYDQLILVYVLLGYLAFVLANRFIGSGGITAYFGVLLLCIIVCVVFTMFNKNKTMSNAMSTILTLAYPVSFMVYMLGLNYLPDSFRNASLFFVFLIPCLTDTLAFLVGSTFKGPKLCPSISPNKTISGAIGGLIGGLIGGAILLLFSIYGWLGLAPIGGSTVTNIVHYLVIGTVGAVFVQSGDLIASYVKRHCAIKDFGKILPGHGGLLDRIDGMIIFSVFLFIYMNIISLI